MHNHNITYFVLRTLLATLPVILFVTAYVVLDPFRVIHRYDQLQQPHDSVTLGYNQGFESIKVLERNLKAGRTYDSFVLGSSISQQFRTGKWLTHLPAGASPFHLDASKESLQGIADKIGYLISKGITVNNAMIVIEEEMLHREPDDANFLFARSPYITRDINWMQFHSLFFNVYKNPLFIKYSICPGHYRQEMLSRRYATVQVQSHDDTTNENLLSDIDSIINANPDVYFTPQRLKRNYYMRNIAKDHPGITPHIEESLAQLARLLNDNKVNYIVIMPPRFNRQPLQPQDRDILFKYLDARRLHDFTRHPYATNPRAYYDKAAHITTARCDTLIDLSYR